MSRIDDVNMTPTVLYHICISNSAVSNEHEGVGSMDNHFPTNWRTNLWLEMEDSAI